MKITMINPSELVHYANNPRKNDHAVEQVAAAIKAFGFRVPVLIKSDKTIIDGHLRCKAALAAGLDTVPCIIADDMTEAQIKAFRISVNKVAELADWDYAALSVELSSIDLDDDDYVVIGFEEREIAALVNDLDIIFDPDSDNSNSGGHSVNKSMSIWLYDYKLTDSRDSSWLFFDEHLADIRSLPQELVIDAIIGGLRGLLD